MVIAINKREISAHSGPSPARSDHVFRFVQYHTDSTVRPTVTALLYSLVSLQRSREMADSSLNHELLCWIGDPVQRGQVLDALNRAIYDGLREADITIPFPQRDVHVHQIA